MKHLSILILALLFAYSASAQNQGNYSRAKIYLDAQNHTIRDLAAQGIAVDHGEYKKNTFFISDFSDKELETVKNAGFKVEIVIADVVKHYQDQNKKKGQKSTSVSCDFTPKIDVPAHFHPGSYAGGYFTYPEMLAILDSMQLLYPGLISVRQPIDTFHSIQGRPLFWVRVSNNPSVDQPAKPQALYTALHHAREPGSLSATIFYLWYLLEHYSTDAHIKAIIDNTELYFVPCVNPDGYIYNSTYYPTGGGMVRKNMRDNLDGTYGVDLNRNYGKFWGYDNIGSSNMTSSDTYRGTAGFSEPETKAIKWFAENHHFKLCLNYHTYHNDILYPWGYIPNFQTVDSSLFNNYCEFLTRENHYRHGTCDQVLNYISNGDSNDWMYGDTSIKKKIFAMTPEIGSNDYAFYPPATQIIPDCQNNILANINSASLLLPFARISHTDNKILVHPSGYLHYTLQRLGFPDTATFTASIKPLDSWLTVGATPKTYTNPAMFQHISDSISYTLSPSTPNGQLVSYVLKLNNGLYDIYDTVQFYYGRQHTITTPSTKSLANWNNNGWGISTTDYYTPSASIQSSSTGADNYTDASDITISTASSVDLSLSTRAYLQFYCKWAVETDYDYVTVNASVAGSGYWQPLCGRYTKPEPRLGFPMYDGQQADWVQEEIDLHDFLGQKINIQYELVSDGQVDYIGYYFDNVSITTVQDTPSAVHDINAYTSSVTIQPNPAHDELTITASGKINSITVSNLLGQTVYYSQYDQSIIPLDISRFPAGMYIVRIATGSGQNMIGKFVKD
jgi:carboxypeptidase T